MLNFRTLAGSLVLVCALNIRTHPKLQICDHTTDSEKEKKPHTHTKHLFGVACNKRTLLVQIHQRRGNHFMTNTQKRQ